MKFRWLPLLIILIISSCNSERKPPFLFTLLPSDVTNINFENTLTETEQFNIIEYLYFYNGGGVAIGDINNDDLPDIYFSSNQESNKLYLNKGNFQFEDITEKSGAAGKGDWATGVTMADVNGDGLLDIYVCNLGNYKGIKGRNQLYINNGDLTFTDNAQEYGLDFEGFSTQASFFDYDNDGDLDMYLLNHAVHTQRSYGRASLRNEKNPRSGDRLYRNELYTGSGGLRASRFVNVTEEAGIYSSHIGYGLAVAAGDVNLDGCIDLYISNDFHENDYLYLNNCDGTFSETLQNAMGHSSRFSMGNDLADINNDGYPDIVTLDMLPEKEDILQKSAGEDPVDVYNIKLRFGYHHQFARNALQLNLGNGYFSDIAPLAGIYATDWSWAPLICDLDNDGLKDLFITNGILRRPNDLDYIKYISNDEAQKALADNRQQTLGFIEKMPSDKIANYAYQNNDNLTFTNKAEEWGLDQKAFSQGTAYADLDNDGDLDLVTNNINEKAFIYRNETDHLLNNNFLKIKLKGTGANVHGIGAKVIAIHEGKAFYQEQIPTRGFLSSVEHRLHFGLGDIEKVDSLKVVWPGGKTQLLTQVPTNQAITLDIQNAVHQTPDENRHYPLFKDITDSLDIDYRHQENSYNDFDREGLITHMLSTQGPGIAIGDINKDGLDDFFVGGAKNQPGKIFMQTGEGFYSSRQPNLESDSLSEDVAAEFFDSNGDGHLDLYVASGGNEFAEDDPSLQDRLYLNNGQGNFIRSKGSVPEIYNNSSCIKQADYDGDGDMDLFLGSRSVPGKYGIDPENYLLENDGSGRFTDVTARIASELTGAGMVTDAEWADIDGDQKIDLIIVGEWMPIRIFKNNGTTLEEITASAGLEKSHGWWNTIMADDIDQDGDLDFIAGNLGLNSKIRASDKSPVKLFIKDFDGNGKLDQILIVNKNGENYPFATKDELSKQIVLLKRKFPSYADYAGSTVHDIFPKQQLKDALVKEAYILHSSYIENLGNGKFEIVPLPIEAQFTPVYGLLTYDFDQDGNMDILLAGNFYAVTPNVGRYDAGYGLFLKGGGKGNFKADLSAKNGFIVHGEVRDIKSMNSISSDRIIVVARNNMQPLFFKLIKTEQTKFLSGNPLK